MDQAKILPGHGSRPAEGDFININVDAGISTEARLAGVGGVARSSTTYLGAWCKPIHGVTDSLVAEALALWEGVIFAKLRGFERVQMETDSQDVVDLRNSRRSSRSLIAPVLLDIEGLADSFTSFSIHHVKRHSNVPAHLCAKNACTLEVTDCWMYSPPGFLVTSLMADTAEARLIE